MGEHTALSSLQQVAASGRQPQRAGCLENLEMSGNLTAVREVSGNKSCQGKLSKTVYCKLHICVHTHYRYLHRVPEKSKPLDV